MYGQTRLTVQGGPGKAAGQKTEKTLSTIMGQNGPGPGSTAAVFMEIAIVLCSAASVIRQKKKIFLFFTSFKGIAGTVTSTSLFFAAWAAGNCRKLFMNTFAETYCDSSVKPMLGGNNINMGLKMAPSLASELPVMLILILAVMFICQ